jgi:hypothetical protein
MRGVVTGDVISFGPPDSAQNARNRKLSTLDLMRHGSL